ncbi:hypothetical protein [Streptomyces pseudogriseolus]|uniref:hypothetical protein n=1 Tax=Streptomyces pseudogriseolus TaxID=36817 RepID=UPI003FA339F2
MDALVDLDDGGFPAADSCLGYRLGLAFALRCGSPTGCFGTAVVLGIDGAAAVVGLLSGPGGGLA